MMCFFFVRKRSLSDLIGLKFSLLHFHPDITEWFFIVVAFAGREDFHQPHIYLVKKRNLGLPLKKQFIFFNYKALPSDE